MAGPALLGACGFQLRQPPEFGFGSVYLAVPGNSPLVAELRRNLQSARNLRVLDAGEPPQSADVVLELGPERRLKTVVARSSGGQIREFQLRTIISFNLRRPNGATVIPPTELSQHRDISFNESAVLSKEAEENLLYRDMQADLVQQLMRRLAAVKT
ncbi:hypothetical protein JI739_13630 [Ramlibacter sp. AW1]|uniref:LPS-assembly lipoprotein LptE n=2 Tax=Ramlibacter aurantiacus TaxID=2801330 RepID=A0A936ZUI1_9BURK|nr:LPS assembly lipoprotein LptE [Ramlibacter aurantiacus]MBL0421395.1 hypothetical protein [Ramlibacter aurantiacus]